ncbi:type II secretion system F family protein [Actinokineospora auranticolor]|uniref:Type II secretion system (T2SS) protein F n=1 Tax=Actinokineospora auranticolor TaxID=155976 RepID=A0A2S6GKM1_9PSEU|nr:type II secretion system F family protein [Actinokineospora auranticolor]PPK65788.1 type II secretion system (T2SS) protein F [Actinokineospora auranticolor]
MSLALTLIALAILIAFPHAPVRKRLASIYGRTPKRPLRKLIPLVFGLALGALVAVVAAPLAGALVAPLAMWTAVRLLKPRPTPVDPFDLAATWDLLAACLRSGMPVPDAIRAVLDGLPDHPRAALREVAESLALGADPVRAWSAALDCPDTAALARGARRSARSGAALAGVARTLATGVRDRADELAEARAQRVTVLVTAPLGLCFLPAFLCAGVAPVLIGLVGRTLN